MADVKTVILHGQRWLVRDDGYRFWIAPDVGNPLLDRAEFSVLEYKHEDQGGQLLARLMFASLPDRPADGTPAEPSLLANPMADSSAQPAIVARQVAEWLFDYESLLNSLANQFKVTRDEDLEGTGRRLEERAREVSAVAARLYDQKGVLRDSGYTDLLLREAAKYLRLLTHFPKSVVFSDLGEFLEAIKRHTTP